MPTWLSKEPEQSEACEWRPEAEQGAANLAGQLPLL